MICENGEMRAHFLPLQTLLLTFSGWTSRHQQEVIEYLREENRVLREQIGDRRLRLTDGQRRRLAAKGKRLGRAVPARGSSFMTLDIVLRWRRGLIASK